MTRRWLAGIPFELALAGSAVLPATTSAASRDDPPIAAAGAHPAPRAIPPIPRMVTGAAGDVFDAVTAAQAAGRQPALPTAPQAAPACAAGTVALWSATLGRLTAGTAATPDPTTMAAAATKLATAGAAINTDKCLPVSLPVPKLPPTTAPVS